jgi:hypothetical protein
MHFNGTAVMQQSLVIPFLRPSESHDRDEKQCQEDMAAMRFEKSPPRRKQHIPEGTATT